MSLRAALNKLQAAGQSGLSAEVRSFADKMDALQRSAPQIMESALREITPAVRAELGRNYGAAGLKIKTGALYGAAVLNAAVFLRRGGIALRMARGGADNLYMIGAALHYGAVHAPRMGGEYKDLSMGDARTTASGFRSAAGEKVKRTLKRHFFGGASFSKREKFAASLAASAKTSGGGWRKAKQVSVPSEMQIPQRAVREKMIAAAVKNAGGITLIKPHRFFYISPAFQLAAQGLLTAAVKRQIAARGVKVQ